MRKAGCAGKIANAVAALLLLFGLISLLFVLILTVAFLPRFCCRRDEIINMICKPESYLFLICAESKKFGKFHFA